MAASKKTTKNAKVPVIRTPDKEAATKASSHDGGCSCGNAQHAAENGFPPTLPDEELLYDLADLFKVFGDTTRIKILYALMGTEPVSYTHLDVYKRQW